MPKKWVQWLINRNLKILVYFVWLIALPIFWFTYLGQAARDALGELDQIKRIKKEN